MSVVYHLNPEEINENLLESIRAIFKNQKVRIEIDNETDETEYLLSSEKNKEKLLDSILQATDKTNLVQVKFD